MEQKYFLSADGKSQIAYYIFDEGIKQPRAILQISHGMKETMNAYLPFVDFFSKHGIVVVGNEDLGHGNSSTSKETDGFFADKNGDKCVVKDLNTMSKIAKERFPNTPIFMFGPSMGSFFARYYASLFPNEIDGFIFCGTSGKVSGTGFGLKMMGLLKKTKGAHTHLAFIDNIMTKKYFRYIKNPISNYEWVTSDINFLLKNDWDNKSTMAFSVGAYYDMVKVLLYINKKKWAKRLNKNTPFLLVSGAQDPVGQYGNGVCDVYRLMEEQKINSIDLILYGMARHQPSYEVDSIRSKFFVDMLSWIEDKVNKLNLNNA